MKISIGKKLLVGFGGALLLMFAAAFLSVVIYLKTVREYEVFTNVRVHQANLVGELTVEFKKEVQYWKDILLRGHDPAKFVKYKEEFEQADRIVRTKIEELKTGPYQLLNEENVKRLEEFEKEYQKLRDGYDAALKIFTGGSGANYREADASVAGKDRPPTQILDALGDRSVEITNEMMKGQADHARSIGIAIFAVGVIVFLLGAFFTFLIIRSITLPLKFLTASAGIVARADLTQEITVKSNDEIGDLADSFRSMIAGLRAILLKVQEATGQITVSGNEILAASQAQASAAREQSSAVTETTAAAKELSTTSESVGESIKKVAQVAAHAMAGMAKIKESIDKTNGMLNSLGEKSQKIGKITELIDDVADQTNLLAVNASIEAARAGEQGRGFTVVADEIRKLADSTAKATKDITSLIELIQHEMSNAIMSMEQSIQSVDEEARLAQQTTEKTKEIAMSTHQQISGAKQISDAMMNIDETMKQVAAGAQQSQVAVKQLTSLAGELNHLASKFKL